MLENGDPEELSISHYKLKLGCEEGEEIRELRCDHLFHRICLDRWLQYKHTTCPLCRGSLARRRADSELGEQELVFRFCSFSSGDRSNWWLR